MFYGITRTVNYTHRQKVTRSCHLLILQCWNKCYISSCKTDVAETSRITKDAGGQYHQRCRQHTHTHKQPSWIFCDTPLLMCHRQTINILALHDFDVDRCHFAFGAVSRCEEFLHLIADLLDVTGVMNKHQQHEVLHTIGVYQQLAAYLPALFSQQKLFKHLPKCKGNISASNRQQTMKDEHNTILNITMPVPTQDSHIQVLTQEADGHVHSSLILYFIRTRVCLRWRTCRVWCNVDCQWVH